MGLKLINGFDMDMDEIGLKMDSWINGRWFYVLCKMKMV